MERRQRTFIHKGKLRFKHRYPRKLKKKLHKKWKTQMDNYVNRLKLSYGDNWFDHFICGG